MANPITDYFVQDPQRLVGEIYYLNRKRGRLSAMMEKGEAPEGMGANYQTLLWDRSGIASDLTWTAVQPNTPGTNPNTCNPNPLTVNSANTVYNYSMIQTLIRSQQICMQDVRIAYQYKDQVTNIRNNFKELVVDAWEDQDKQQFFNLPGHKIVANAALTDYYQAADFGTALPTSQLTAGIMRNLYEQLDRDAGGEEPVAQVAGAAQYPMLCSSEQYNAVIQQDQAIRQDIRYAQMGEGSVAWLMQSWNVDRAYAGFLLTIDNKMPRWDFNTSNGTWVSRPYYTYVSATNGLQAVVNPAYQNAAYEDVYIFLKETIRRDMPRPFATGGADTRFNPVNFNGDILWQNILNEDTNPLGLVGRYYAALLATWKPMKPQYSYVIRCQRCSNLTLNQCY